MLQGEVPPLAGLIRRFRLSAGLSQEELAERSGLSARTISDLERGLSLSPRPETMRMLAQGLGLEDSERATLVAAARPELRTRHSIDSTEAPMQLGNPLVDLPALPNVLIGRESDLAGLTTRVTQRTARLITLTGPGGVGKTRLALEVAHRVAPTFPGGVTFVDLAPISNPDLVASTIAQALNIAETRDRSPEAALCSALVSRPPMLLLLDNFEQVIEAAPLVRRVLDAAPRLVILVTSREPLRVRGEDEFETPPLDVPSAGTSIDVEMAARIPSVALFVQSARAARHDFVLTEFAAEPVSEICRRLDGLPLAIELAATRTRHFPPDVLLRHLEPRLPLLTGGPRDRPARQQTVRNTIAWSYDLLDTDEQALLRQLGVFVGGASLETIEAVVSTSSTVQLDVLATLSSLVDKHLVRRKALPDGSPRFSLLELVREFAIEQLHLAHEYRRARQAHALFFLDELQRAGATWVMMLHGFPGQEMIAVEMDDIQAAMDWFDEERDPERLAQLAISIWGYCYRKGLFREERAREVRVMELMRDRPLSASLEASVLGSLSGLMSVLGDAELALSYATRSVELARQLPDEPGLLPISLIALTVALRDQHRLTSARECAVQALPTARIRGVDAFIEPFVLFHIGRISYLQGDMPGAVSILSESLAQIHKLGPTETALYSLSTLSKAHLKLGNLAEAVGLMRQSCLMLSPGGYTGYWFDSVILLAVRCGLPDHAARILGCHSASYSSLGIDESYLDPWLEVEISSLRAMVGKAHFDAEFKTGSALTLDGAMEVALQVLDQAEAQFAN